MKKRYSIYFIFLAFLSTASFAQNISFEEAGNICTNAGTMILTFSTSGGSPVRKVYVGYCNNGNGLLKVIWANNQWEIQWDTDGDDVTETVMYYSTYASAPNPPALHVGNWTEGGLGCDNLTRFSGTGTQAFIALPVELVAFNARLQGANTSLSWQTASEQNNAGFQVERSADGSQWYTLHFVPGHGTSAHEHHYSFLDEKPLPGANYYRLRQVDFDGGEELSKVVSVEFSERLIQVFPNPVSGDEMTLVLPEYPEEEVTVRIFSSAGQLLHSTTLADGVQTVDVSGLTTGIYWLEVVGRRGREVMKMAVNK